MINVIMSLLMAHNPGISDESAVFQVGLDLIYILSRLPEDNVLEGWEQVVLPYFEDNFEENRDVDLFLGQYCKLLEKVFYRNISKLYMEFD